MERNVCKIFNEKLRGRNLFIFVWREAARRLFLAPFRALQPSRLFDVLPPFSTTIHTLISNQNHFISIRSNTPSCISKSIDSWRFTVYCAYMLCPWKHLLDYVCWLMSRKHDGWNAELLLLLLARCFTPISDIGTPSWVQTRWDTRSSLKQQDELRGESPDSSDVQRYLGRSSMGTYCCCTVHGHCRW